MKKGTANGDVRAFFLHQRHHVMPSIRLMVFPLAPADGAGFAEGLLDTAAAGVRTDCTTRDGDIRTGADARAASWTKVPMAALAALAALAACTYGSWQL